MIAAQQAQKIGAAALAPAHVAGVIDEAGKIGVFEIDAHGQHMPAPRRILDETAGEIGPIVCGRVVHGARRADCNGVVTRRIDQTPSSIMTISGGAPKRTGKPEQPRPRETMRLRPSSTMWP
jgi:hypothetical protein